MTGMEGLDSIGVPSVVFVPWPEGVEHRYLTVGYATVDVSRVPGTVNGRAACTGCPAVHRTDGFRADMALGPEEAAQRNIDVARTWAGHHASRCRSIARPIAHPPPT